jgi:hypothetical protein
MKKKNGANGGLHFLDSQTGSSAARDATCDASFTIELPDSSQFLCGEEQ